METVPDTLLHFDLGEDFRRQIESLSKYSVWFSTDCTFALIYLGNTSESRHLNSSYHLAALKTAAIRRVNQLGQFESFAFSRACDDRLLKASFGAGQLQVDSLQIHADLSLTAVACLASFRETVADLHSVVIESLEWGFLVDHIKNCKFGMIGMSSQKQLLVENSVGDWVRLSSRDYQFLKMQRQNQMGLTNGRVYCIDSWSSRRMFGGTASASPRGKLLIKLSCRRLKLTALYISQTNRKAVLMSKRFSAVVKPNGGLQLVNVRSDKHAGRGQVCLGFLKMQQYSMLDGRIVNHNLYLQDYGQVQKFDISSGSPVLVYVITADADNFGFDRFSARLENERYLMLRRKKTVETALRINSEVMAKTFDLAPLKSAGLEITLTSGDQDVLKLGSMDFYRQSRSMYTLFTLMNTFGSGNRSRKLQIDIAVVHGDYMARSSVCIEQESAGSHFDRPNRFLLLAFNLDTNALEYKVIRFHAVLSLADVARDHLSFTFFALKNQVQRIQSDTGIAVPREHLERFGNRTNHHYSSGVLRLPKQL